MIVEIGRAERSGGARQRLEDRFQFGQAAPFGVGNRRRQPRVNGHGFFTEIERPSRSGTVVVIRPGCEATRSLYSAIARVSAGGGVCGARARGGAPPPPSTT